MRGDPWLYLSSLGIGSYLGEADAATDELVRPLGQRQSVLTQGTGNMWGSVAVSLGPSSSVHLYKGPCTAQACSPSTVTFLRSDT